MAKAGLYAAEVTTNAPADGAATTKDKGYQWLEYGAAAPPPVEACFYDTFTDADGTLLSDHTSDINVTGNSWVNWSAIIDIQNNKATIGGNSIAICYIDTGTADVDISCIMSVGTTDAPRSGGLIWRFAPGNESYYMLYISNYDGFQNVTLYRVLGGSFNLIEESSKFITPEVDYNFRVLAIDQSIKIYVDDVMIIDYANATQNLTSTFHGMQGTSGFGNIYWDDYNIICDPTP